MSWVFCTSGSAIVKAGVNANSVIVASGSALAQWSDDVEDTLCTIARYDLIANYATLTTNGKKLLGRMASADIANRILSYDINAYSNRTSETIMDKNQDEWDDGVALLKEDKNKTYLGIT